MLQGQCGLEHRADLATSLLGEVFHHLLQDVGTGILDRILAMTKAPDLGLVLQLFVEPGRHILGIADLRQHIHHPLIGPAMQWAGQGADGGRDHAIGTGQGGTRYQRGEGGGIDRMFGMQNQAGIHDLGMVGIRLTALEHIKKILRRGQILSRRDGIIALTDVLPHRHNDRNTGNNLHCHAVDVVHVLTDIHAAKTLIRWIKHPQTGHRRLQHLHWVAAGGQALHHLTNVELDPAITTQQGVKLRQGHGRGKLAIQQQQGGLFKGTLCGQLLDRITTIGQDPLITIDKGDIRAGGRHPFKTGQISAHA